MSGRRATDTSLDALRAAADDCVQRETNAANPILLSGPTRTLAVLEGAVDLFAFRREAGRQVGPRLALGRLGAGELTLAPAHGKPGLGARAGNDLALLAVGVAGTRVAENVDLGRLGPAHRSALVDRLVACFGAALDNATAPAERRELVDPGAVDLVDGTVVAAQGRRPLWVRPTAGARLLLGGVADACEGGLDAVPVPLTARLWARAVGHGGATACRVDDLEDPDRALEAFRVRIATVLLSRLQQESGRASERVRRQRAGSADALTRSLHELADVITPRPPAAATPGRDALFTALQRMGSEIGVTLRDPRGGGGFAHLTDLEAITTASGVRTREVLLRGDWWHHDAGPLLAWLDGATPVALLHGRGGYGAVIPGADGSERRRVDAAFAARLDQRACMLYRPLPDVVRGPFDLLRPIADLALPEARRYLLIGLAAGLFAAATPLFTGLLLEHVIPRASLAQFAQVLAGLLAVGLGAVVFEVVRAATLLRAAGRADLHLQAAVVDRLLRVPVRFFRDYASGDLAERAMGIHAIRSMLTSGAISALLGALFSLSSLALMVFYSPSLAALAVGLVAVQIAVGVGLTLWQLRHQRAEIDFEGRVEGFTTQLLTALGKLRVAAADVRGYARWLSLFAEQRRRFVATQRIANLRRVIFSFLPTLTIVAVNVGAVTRLGADGTALGLGAFIAFTAAFGQFQGACAALVGALMDSIAVVPRWERLKPILATAPERIDGVRAITLRGEIELAGVTLRYPGAAEPAVADLSLHIRAGEFVALVGSSGAGKSSVLRLLLGFEQPERGTVLFDGLPADTLDPGALRRQTGVVLQHGQLTSGTILSNIVGTSTLTRADAARAAAQVGLDADLEAMPMGLHTVVTEGVNTLSGGQRQRLLLARALVRQPRILFLDEATSALDNRTQEVVSTTLRELDCTRVVVAHRLSTIAHADRIVVLEGGRVVQQGPFEALMAEDGPFRTLAERQLM